MANLVLKFDFRNQESVNLSNKKVTDLSGSGNDGVFSFSGAKLDPALGLYIPTDYSHIRVAKNLFQPLQDYSIRCIYQKIQQTGYGPAIKLASNRDKSGLFPYFTFYQPGSATFQIWNYGSGGIIGPTVALGGIVHKATEPTNFDSRIIIDGTDRKATISEALQKKSITSEFSNTLNGDAGFTKIFEKEDGVTFWLQQIMIYEGIVNFDDSSLILDNNLNIYTINSNGNLEVIAKESELNPALFDKYGRSITEYSNIKDKLQINGYKIVTLQRS